MVVAALTPAMPLQDAFRRATALRVDVVGDVEGRPVPPRPAAIKPVELSASRVRTAGAKAAQVVMALPPTLAGENICGAKGAAWTTRRIWPW